MYTRINKTESQHGAPTKKMRGVLTGAERAYDQLQAPDDPASTVTATESTYFVPDHVPPESVPLIVFPLTVPVKGSQLVQTPSIS